MPRFVLLALSLTLAGCGAVVATVDTAASLADSAVGVAGDVVETTVDVVTAPLRSDDKDD